MRRTCEVCENFRNLDDLTHLKIVEVHYSQRSVLLCTGHAKIAERSGVTRFDELRELYGEGRRSYIPRRRPAVFQPDGESRRSGRRVTDV
jgi:hypothetical protein